MYQVPSAGKINPANQSKFKVNKQLRPVQGKEKLKEQPSEPIGKKSSKKQVTSPRAKAGKIVSGTRKSLSRVWVFRSGVTDD